MFQCIARQGCAMLQHSTGMLRCTVRRCSDWSVHGTLYFKCGLLTHKLVWAAHSGSMCMLQCIQALWHLDGAVKASLILQHIVGVTGSRSTLCPSTTVVAAWPCWFMRADLWAALSILQHCIHVPQCALCCCGLAMLLHVDRPQGGIAGAAIH